MRDPSLLTSVSEAVSVIARQVRVLPGVELPLAEAAGLTLAAPVVTDTDYPPFDRAIMDGFAVRSGDCAGGHSRLRIAGEVAAGQVAERAIAPGEAVPISTGAPLPPGADAVVMVERAEVSPDGTWMTTDAAVPAGHDVARRGSMTQAGQVVLETGVRLGAAQMAAAVAAGAARVCVYRRPRLAVLVTGDELVAVDQRPGGAQIRNSNGPCLAALAREAGCELIDLGVTGDARPLLASRLAEGLRADVLCVSGGVSVGRHDYVPAVLAEAGVKFHVRKVAVRPGKPIVFGSGPDGQAVFGIPGNPVSCFVCFLLFVRAALAVMQGRPGWPPPVVSAVLTAPLGAVGDRQEFVPAHLQGDEHGHWRVAPVSWQGSGDPFGLARASGLMIREPWAAAAGAGGTLPVVPLAW